MFTFHRKASKGKTLPSWFTTPGPDYVRKFVRHSKHSPVVKQVELLQATPTYAHIRYSVGRESAVSLRDLAPCVELENVVKMRSDWYDNFHATDYDNANSSVLDNPRVSANENVTNSNESVIVTDNLNQASDTPVSLELSSAPASLDVSDTNGEQLFRTRSGRVVRPSKRLSL